MLTRWTLILLIGVSGCAHSHSTTRPAALPTTSTSATNPATVDFDLAPMPPAGWKPQAPELTKRSVRQLWLSPTGATGYGIIRFDLPWILGPGMTLPLFIEEVSEVKGPTRLVSSGEHRPSGGVQFVADLPQLQMRGILWTRLFTGWVVYASTDKSVPVNAEELSTALSARDASVPARR